MKLDEINEFEKNTGYILPKEYIDFLMISNGAEIYKSVDEYEVDDWQGKRVRFRLYDDDNFNWKTNNLSKKELHQLINTKQSKCEIVGIVLHYDGHEEGITLLANATKEIIMNININRRTIENKRESITDFVWYFNNLLKRIVDRKCFPDNIKFEDYEG